ncbi:MAG: MMPL family transporter, partial [Thermodesulfobacteriota bacterium]|nr:MMPL family transporter [Thermodesulfobacteriota bacterium]
MIILLLTVVFLLALKNFRLSYDLSSIAPREHPYVKLQKKMEKVFGGTNLISIGLVVNEGGIFNPTTVGKIYRITKQLRELRGVVPYRILSITSRKLKYVYTSKDPDGMSVLHAIPFEELAESIINGNTEALTLLRKACLRDDLIFGPIVSTDLKGTIIQADFIWEKDYEYIFEKVQEIVAQEEDANIRFHIGGRPIELGYISQYTHRILYIFGFTTLIILFLLFLSFKSKRGMFLPTSSAIMTVVWGLGIMGLFSIPLDIMSITVPFIILAVAVSHGVQLIKRYYENFMIHGENITASKEAFKTLLRPGIAAIITDSTAFLALLLLPFPAIQSMAKVATISILSIIFTTFLFIPLMLTYMPSP